MRVQVHTYLRSMVQKSKLNYHPAKGNCSPGLRDLPAKKKTTLPTDALFKERVAQSLPYAAQNRKQAGGGNMLSFYFILFFFNWFKPHPLQNFFPPFLAEQLGLCRISGQAPNRWICWDSKATETEPWCVCRNLSVICNLPSFFCPAFMALRVAVYFSL